MLSVIVVRVLMAVMMIKNKSGVRGTQPLTSILGLSRTPLLAFGLKQVGFQGRGLRKAEGCMGTQGSREEVVGPVGGKAQGARLSSPWEKGDTEAELSHLLVPLALCIWHAG